MSVPEQLRRLAAKLEHAAAAASPLSGADSASLERDMQEMSAMVARVQRTAHDERLLGLRCSAEAPFGDVETGSNDPASLASAAKAANERLREELARSRAAASKAELATAIDAASMADSALEVDLDVDDLIAE